MRRAFGLIVGLLGAVVGGVATADTGLYDGAWSVTLDCPRSDDGALPFSYAFNAEVKDGVLHGEHGQTGEPGWLALDGRIQPDGAADLDARGITGVAAYDVEGATRGVPYRHPVTAHFAATHGAGTWTTTRVCTFSFER